MRTVEIVFCSRILKMVLLVAAWKSTRTRTRTWKSTRTRTRTCNANRSKPLRYTWFLNFDREFMGFWPISLLVMYSYIYIYIYNRFFSHIISESYYPTVLKKLGYTSLFMSFSFSFPFPPYFYFNSVLFFSFQFSS